MYAVHEWTTPCYAAKINFNVESVNGIYIMSVWVLKVITHSVAAFRSNCSIHVGLRTCRACIIVAEGGGWICMVHA